MGVNTGCAATKQKSSETKIINTLYHGDNLSVLRSLLDASIDLIATDPPFCTQKDWGAFSDKWGGLKEYLKFMEVRCVEMHRVLKDTGSFYLHCDPTASHYLKVMLDGIFGIKQFRNEIVWKRHNSHNDTLYGNIHDTILFYSYGDKKISADVRIPLSKERLKNYRHSDERGIYATTDLTAGDRRKGKSGQAWRGVELTRNHWSPPRSGKYAAYIEKNFISKYRSIDDVHERLDILEANNLIHWSKHGNPRLKRYLMPDAGQPPQSLWTDIKPVGRKQKIGYPTQKPVALYERIIKASSNQGDTVLDPFAGSGTTLDAAHTLGRQWIGIDSGEQAIQTIIERMRHRHGLEYDRDYEIQRS